MTDTSSLYLKTASSLVTGVVAILGALWALDNHYASAADLRGLEQSIEKQVRILQQERVEDEMFKLDMKKQSQKGKLSPEDAALYERYSRKITIITNEQKAAETVKPTSK
jgi:hypothetical protein